MKNFVYCQYTYRHRKAFKYVVEKLFADSPLKDEMLKRAEVHDMDKMVDYLTLDKETASFRHRMRAAHHMENGIDNKSDIDLYEMIVDFECAGYTKPDKPRNAAVFINDCFYTGKINAQQVNRFDVLLDKLGINRAYSVTNDTDGMNYLSQFDNPTEDNIMAEVQNYLNKKS